MKKAIVSGATGAIGIALIQELISCGIKTLVLCRKGSSRNARIPNHPLVQKMFCDLNELSTLENTENEKYDVFFHLAWAGTTGAARNDMYLQNQNVKYALDAVAAAHRFGCSTFVGAGSQAEYGRVEGNLSAKTPVFPEMGYGYGKLCAGLMTKDFAHQLGMKHMWIRILSVYGPYDGMQSLVSSVISSALNGISPNCTKGEQQWDYLYSKDAARAFRLTGEKGIDGKTYVLGSGKVQPLAAYITLICNKINPDIAVNFGAIPYNSNQVMHLCADITDLHQDTGFVSEYSFEEGITETIKWFKENKLQ